MWCVEVLIGVALWRAGGAGGQAGQGLGKGASGGREDLIREEREAEGGGGGGVGGSEGAMKSTGAVENMISDDPEVVEGANSNP